MPQSLPPAPLVQAPLWSGFYAGLYAGSISGTSKATLQHNDPLTPGVTASTMFGGAAETSFSPTGGTVAIALGYNWHQPGGLLVYGVEVDMAWAGASASATVVSTDTLTTWNLETKLYSLGTLRGRLGVPAGPVLLYGTAGLGWALGETDNRVTCTGCAFTPWSEGTSKSISHVGFVGGGGAEVLLGQYFVLRAEYLFASLGNGKHTFNGTSAAGTVVAPNSATKFVYDWDGSDQSMSFGMWRIGASLKFN
jgi:outer membrane immunogenic protein